MARSDFSDEERELSLRVREIVDLAGSAAELGRRAGISAITVRDYANGRAVPTAVRLAKLAAAGGVSIEWLATGRGPKNYTLTGDEGPAAGLDRALMARVVDCIAKVYKAERVALSDLELGSLSAEKYVELARAKPTNLDEILVLIRMLREQLRAQLRTAAPGDDKRQVSGS